jgi:ribulose-phosphate 3-epimerase
MIVEPGRYARQFVEAGANNVTIHIEAVDDPRPVFEQIHAAGATAGLALNPDTPISRIEPFLDDCDVVLVMSVMPGFGGQSFQRVALDKLRALRRVDGGRLTLGVDGGVNDKTISDCGAAGADLLVVGSAIFHQTDYTASVARLTNLAQSHA